VPFIVVDALPQAEGIEPQAVLRRLNEAVAELLEREPDVAWSLWREVEPGRYLVGTEPAGRQPAATHPPLVTIMLARPPEVAEQIAELVGEVLDRELGLEPGSSFVHVQRLD
jgi:phenylpyruvate tautomerase PptA (4-oxalocrotonate tautomerase family)